MYDFWIKNNSSGTFFPRTFFPEIVGAVLGGFVFSLPGVSAGGLIGSIITATVGAIILLSIISIIKKA